MRTLLVVALVVFLGWLDLCSRQAKAMRAPLIYPIDRNDFTNPSQFTFLGSVLKDVEVVSLGESIHMTHEFPLVRLGVVRYLNENLGFHVLVIEGSAPDVWVAQDRLLRSARTAQDAQQALDGFFGLWNTSEMQKLIKYDAESWQSSHPLYIAGYDVQLGNGRGSQGLDVFEQLLDRLMAYATPPKGFDPAQWMHNIEPIVAKYQVEDRASVEAAIQTLEQWISRAAPEIEKRYPDVPHASALRLLPINLRAALQFRDDLAKPNSQGYQGLRDINAAGYVLQLKNAVAGQKIMLWAHISHLHNDSDQGTAAVGGILQRSLGPRLYTIASFAESGGAILIFPSGSNEDIGYGRVHGERGDLGQRLSGLSKQDYFLDLRSLPAGPSADSVFWTQQPLWVEAGQSRLIITRQFDGIVWIKSVHAPDLTPFVLVVSIIHYRRALILIGISVALIIVLVLLYLFVRWRRRRHKPVAASVLA